MAINSHALSKMSQVATILAIGLGALLLDGLIVAWLWVEGVDFAIMDRVLPGESGFHINPLASSYKWLLSAVLAANIGLLLYLLTKSKWRYAISFAMGAAIPMGYLIEILASA